MDALFTRAEVPEPFRILGVRLRPLCLGHLILLHRFDSAFVTADRQISLGDLLLSIIICADTFEAAIELLNDGTLLKRASAWGRRIGRQINMESKAALFQRYLSEAIKLPQYARLANAMNGDVSEFGAPMLQIIKVRVMRDLQMSHREIMNRPIGAVLWDFLTLSEIDGSIQIKSDEMRNRQNEEIERLKAELAGNPSLKIICPSN